jgi:hypothetical protein
VCKACVASISHVNKPMRLFLASLAIKDLSTGISAYQPGFPFLSSMLVSHRSAKTASFVYTSWMSVIPTDSKPLMISVRSDLRWINGIMLGTAQAFVHLV